jgi:anaerobic dimethyl sulfoxide reductase subunit B (iron-sulfur subunit)
LRYAFTFDASACTGCKACQVACKDKNALPAGVLWRRVYEVSGGEWHRNGAAWTNTVFAYNVSVSCNHCADPVCVGVCPTGAYEAREDGVVYQHSERCLGCQYCAWACPYGAPQYSPELGRTTKCDFCIDLIGEGLPPACVAACPMRALDIVETQRGAETPRRAEAPRVPFPLPDTSARPSIVINPHPAMLNELPKTIANYEEVRPMPAAPRSSRAAADQPPAFAPRRRTAATAGKLASRLRADVPSGGYGGQASLEPLTRDLGEWPLVAFTLLGQAAAGAALLAALFGPLSNARLLLVGALFAAATLSSLLHPGRAGGAWRAPVNLKKSALSREIVTVGCFAAAWLLASIAPGAGRIALAFAAVALVESMVRVYDLESVPGWTRSRTRFAFAASAVLLGALALLLLWASTTTPLPWTAVAVAVTTAIIIQQVAARRRFYLRPVGKVM